MAPPLIVGRQHRRHDCCSVDIFFFLFELGLIFVILRLLIVKLNVVDASDVLLAIPPDRPICLPLLHGQVLKSKFLHYVIIWLVSSECYRTQLIIVPLLAVDALRHQFFVSVVNFQQKIFAVLTNVDPKPHSKMCGFLFFALDAIHVVRNTLILIQIFVQSF